MGPQALAALAQSEFTVVLSAYRNATTERAHVMLPIAPFTETGGTFVNMEGRVQSFNAVVKPQGDARPGWKVLRMLGAILDIPGIHADTIEAVRKQIAPDLQAWARAGLGNTTAPFTWELRTPGASVERIAEFAIYAGDPIVRRSARCRRPPTARPRAPRASTRPRSRSWDRPRASACASARAAVRPRSPLRSTSRSPTAPCASRAASRRRPRWARARSPSRRSRKPPSHERDRRHRTQGWRTTWFGPDWGPQAFFVGKSLAMIVAVLVPLLLTVLYYQLVERWVIGWIQVRKGPNRVGWKGILQPIADAIKLLMKEQMIPSGASKALFLLAPIISVAPALAAWSIVPFAPGWVIANVDAAILLMLAMTSMGVYGIIIAGWASNSKYAFIGAMRAAAQMVSYEIAMGFALVGALMAGQSMNLTAIVARQDGDWGFLEWFWLPLLPLFVIHFIAGLAETNRAPFDVAEGESEIVAGFHVEYSGMTFAVFFLAEYANMILISTISALLFWGGWLSPFNFAFIRDAGPAFSWLAAPSICGCSPRSRSSCSRSCGCAPRSRASATTRSCGWAGRYSFPSRWCGSRWWAS